MSQSIIDELVTVRDWLRYACSRFAAKPLYYGHGTDNVWDEAVHLVLRSLHLPLENNTVFLDARLNREERSLVLERIQRRVRERIPVPYLLGEAWFMGMPFRVNSQVLIPRSPIGQLLENGLQPWLGDLPVERVLDLCTGSGCIGIGASLVFDRASVDLSDVSRGALDVARENISLHEVGDRVQVIESDVFDRISGKYDVILTNPPYVDAEDMADIPPEYRHEPRMALAAGEDGLEIVRRILEQAHEHLSPGGMLVGEVGNSQAALEEAFPSVPFTWLELEEGGHGVFLLWETDLRNLRIE